MRLRLCAAPVGGILPLLICDWDGVYCNDAGRVTDIELYGSGKELGTLTQLTFLYLRRNNLTGELPLSLANLTQLEYLSLYSNQLHGSIPPEIGTMKNLIYFILNDNNLTGLIPSSFDIIQATEDFDIKYCIGTGGYGSVYRAQLPSGKVVALKKLHGWEREDPTYLKSFEMKFKCYQEYNTVTL
ncbi:Leucine-rich repeat protein 1 [Vitis vinifera]|uniref:Leucine-rich repeat protein 1 n=1 Tax=Vitis vinifera TaxID=29760 RepID=A0A438GHH8_VITVI|nr:Leucine-rich repeat protein 1 [Vitis vinifera]